MRHLLLISALIFGGFQQALSATLMRQACQFVDDSLNATQATPGVVIIEQSNNDVYDGSSLLSYDRTKDDSEENTRTTNPIPFRVRVFLNENFGLDTSTYQEKANALIDNPPNSAVREYPKAMGVRHNDWTFMSLDGSLDGANGSSLLWYSDDGIPSSYQDVEIHDSRWVKCGPRYLYEIPANIDIEDNIISEKSVE